MKWSKVNTFLDLLYHLVSNELTAHELFSTMNNTMTYRLDILECRKDTGLLVKKGIDNCLDTDGMILDRHFLYNLFLTCCLMLEATCFHSDSLDKTFGKKVVHLVILHIKKLILE